MVFPSKALNDWCKNVQALINSSRNHRPSNSDGFSQSEVFKAVEFAPIEQRAQLLSGLFWSVWIDQVMYYILVENSKDKTLYETFRGIYPFPKLRSHPSCGQASPSWLMGDDEIGRGCPKPNEELLLEDKKEFWGEISDWLTSIDRSDVKDLAEGAFKEDLRIRFNPALKYLFE
jgi:hypothetical protein